MEHVRTFFPYLSVRQASAQCTGEEDEGHLLIGWSNGSIPSRPTLNGDREGQYSIRINKPWRLCFKWQDGDAFDVEIVDYH
jgi:hypothetical protein